MEQQVAGIHQRIDELIDYNQFRVLKSFQKHRVSDSHFIPSTGYGYDDTGRDTLEDIYADVFGAKRLLCVRKSFPDTCHRDCSFWVLRPGDELIYITGRLTTPLMK